MVVADANNDGRQDIMIGPENSWSQYLFLNLPSFAADTNANFVPDSCEFIAACPGDVSGIAGTPDGTVNFADVAMVLASLGSNCEPS